MKRLIYKLLLAVTIFLAVVSCDTKTEFTQAEKQAATDSVKATLMRYQQEIADHGLMSEFKYLDNSKDFFWVPPGYDEAMPYDSIAKAIKENAKLMKGSKLKTTFEKLQIVPLTKEYATYTAKLKSVITDSTGKSTAIRLLETGLMVKRKEGWKLQSGQTSAGPY